MIPWLSPDSIKFPNVTSALKEPNGLLAVGGDLSPERLIEAYKLGIFPWYNEDEPILWWSPSPRCVLIPNELYVAKSLAKLIRKEKYKVTFDQSFRQVIEQCALTRKDKEGTWISQEMIAAYDQLFLLGYAHSVEVWSEDKLIGGLYGLAIGNIFYGESMFSVQSNASKIAFHALATKLSNEGFTLIDCQVNNNHLMSLGAKEIPQAAFMTFLQASLSHCKDSISCWQ